MRLYRLKELQSQGREWRRQFDELLFVGQLPIEEAEVEQLCASLGRYPQQPQQDEDFWAVATVAVVNLAYYSVSDDRDAFCGFALKKLNHLPDRFWNDSFGPSILRILKVYFGEKERTGPYRYVSPIMRQAGVPARSLPQFSAFLKRLTRRHGLRFSQAQFDDCLRAPTIQSNNLRAFLCSDIGWKFCRDVVRILGQPTEEAAVDRHSLPGFRKAWFEQLGQSLQFLPVATPPLASLPDPKLALDFSRLQLVLEFDEKGLNGGYRWANSNRRVTASRLFLKAADFATDLEFSITPAAGSSQLCRPRLWQPTPTSWAAFQLDGAFYMAKEERRDLRPGLYILALPQACEVAQTRERLGELYVPDLPDLNLQVVECELPPGFRIPELDLGVRTAARAALPTLRFARHKRFSVYTHNVFVTSLPRIEIVNWTQDFARDYRIVCETGKHLRYLPEALYREQSSFSLNLAAPAQGRIEIEPRGWTPKHFTGSTLRFTLLPEGELRAPECLLEKADSVSIHLHPAARFTLHWDTPPAKEITVEAPGSWMLPAGADVIEGRASYQDSVTFSISGTLRRVQISSTAIEKNVLWRDSLKQRTPIEIALSEEEIGKAVDVGLMNGHFERATRFGLVPGNGVLRISTDDIRDALADSLAGYLAVQLPSSRIVRSDIAYLNDKQIAASLRDESAAQDWLQFADEATRDAVQALRAGSGNRAKTPSLGALALPAELKRELLLQEICSLVIDGDADSEVLLQMPEDSLKTILTWYLAAGEFTKANAVNLPRATQLLQQAPQRLTELPFKRWRDAIEERRAALSALTDFFNSIEDWRALCREQNWRLAREESAIGRMAGGRKLTDAAAAYFYALEARQLADNEQLFAGLEMAQQTFQEARQQAKAGLIYELAWGLEVMTLYHYGDTAAFARQASAFVARVGEPWQRLKRTFQHLSGAASGEAAMAASLGLSHISPHPADFQIEERLDGQQR